MNAFARIGQPCVSMLVVGGLSAVAMFAAAPDAVNITLPHSVEVGSATLPGGVYTMNKMSMASYEVVFVVRNAQGDAVTLQAHRIQNDAAAATKVQFSSESDGAWRFDKLFIVGETTGYEFDNAK